VDRQVQATGGGGGGGPPGPPGVFLGIITGLAAEARIGGGLGLAIAGGGWPQGAAEAAARLADAGAAGLISFGLAGGLTDALPPGALIVPASVVSGGSRYSCDLRLCEWLGGTTGHVLCAASNIAATRTEKSALRHMTGADAVDLESGAVATVAAARGLRFAVLRAICDPADTDLPPAALIALDAHGAIGIGRVLVSLLRQPAQLPALLRLSAQASRARATLVRAVAGVQARGAFVPS
jgi:adenosylhomocysteine nucleosidase